MTVSSSRPPFRSGPTGPTPNPPTLIYADTGWLNESTGAEWVASADGTQWIAIAPGTPVSAPTTMPVTYRGTPGSGTIFYSSFKYPSFVSVIARTQTGVTESTADPGLFEYTQDVTLSGGFGQFVARWDEGVPTVFSEEFIIVPGGTGATGPAGTNGTNGTNGANGTSVLSGTGAPSSGTGVNGDFYIDTTVPAIYGPKSGGVWGSATSLVGPAGPAGSGTGSAHYVGEVFDFWRPDRTVPLPSGCLVCDGRVVLKANHGFTTVAGSITLPNLIGKNRVGADPAKAYGYTSTGPSDTPGENSIGGANSVDLTHLHSVPGQTVSTSGVIGGSTGVSGSTDPASGLTTGTGGSGNSGTTHANGTTGSSGTGQTTITHATGTTANDHVSQLVAGGGLSVTSNPHDHTFDDGGHSHAGPSHTHTFDDGGHVHTLPGHSHGMPAMPHTHSIPAAAPHTHNVTTATENSGNGLGPTDNRQSYVGFLPLMQVVIP